MSSSIDPAGTDRQDALLTALEACARSAVSHAPAAEEVIRRASGRVVDLIAAEPGPRGVGAALAGTFVSEIFSGLWLEAPWDEQQAAAVLDAFAEASGVSSVALGLDVLRHPGLLQLPPQLAVEAHTEMLLAFTRARHVSLWIVDGRGRISCAARAGAARAPGGVRALVEALLSRPHAQVTVEGRLVAAPVLRWDQPHAAIVAQAGAEGSARCRPFIDQAPMILAPMLERQGMLAGGARAERVLVEAHERRLARLGLDLHDGPLQTVIAVAQEMYACRQRLHEVLQEHALRDRVLGWFDDLEARLEALEAELRDYASSVGSPGVLRQPLPDVLSDLVGGFRARNPIEAELSVTGELDHLTQSQQIAIVRIVQEGLNNVAAHSGAANVRVSVAGTRDHVTASVLDDGCGFDMERTLVRAASAGRLGLLGMDERVRLLGGTFRVRSRPGGPTELSASLPRWDPEGLTTNV